jgi:hypothetical protein
MTRFLIALVLYASLPLEAEAGSHVNVVLQWNQAVLQGVRDGTLGPPMAARALAVVHTCIYDAWGSIRPESCRDTVWEQTTPP